MYVLTRFQRWMLKRIIRKFLVSYNLGSLFDAIYDEHRRVFYEDNHYDLSGQLREHVETTIAYKLYLLSQGSRDD